MSGALEPENKAEIAMATVNMEYIAKCEALYEELMAPFPLALGKAASKKEREEIGMVKNTTLVYGEISFQAFAIAMEKIKNYYGKPLMGESGTYGIMQKSGGKFYDLGSGTGKPVFGAAILHDFVSCVGIEILEGLYSISLDALASYDTKGKSKLGRDRDTYCQFLLGDFLNLGLKDWKDADVVFANSTCYDDKMMEAIARMALGLKRGAFFVSLTKRLPSHDFVVLEHELYRMSWGDATVYIMQKITDPREVPEEDEAAQHEDD